MKKTFRSLSMAALLIVGAIMTGCISGDNIDNPLQPANNDNVLTLTTTVSLDGGAIDTSTGKKTFEATNTIAVIYKNASNETKRAESGSLTLSADGTKATFTVLLTNPNRNSAIRYIYPYSMSKDVATDATITSDDATINYSGLFSSQDGNLITLGKNYDLAVFDGNLSGTQLPATASLTNPLAICALTLTDGTNAITSSVTSLNVSDGTNTYHLSPSGLSTIYVAMKPVASKNIAFTAATGSKTYFKTTALAQTLAASKIYTSVSVSMVELAVGSVFCDDGSVYASKDVATAASKTPVAMIAYLGSENGEASPYNHGLALAMSDAGSGELLKWSTSSTDAHTTKQTSDNFTSESGLNYNETHNTDDYPAFKAAIANNSIAAPTGCSAWFLASGYQWQKMITTAGGISNLKTNADLKSYFYWSSSEDLANFSWVFYAADGVWSDDFKGDGILVRSCLAF